MRNLLSLLLFVPSLCLAQLPDYVPTDGLVGWYPFDGNPANAASELNDAAPQNNFIFVEHDNRFFISTEGSGAGIGTTGGHILFPDISISSFDEFSISGWVRTIEVFYIHGESYFSLGRSPLEFSIDDNSNMSPPTVLTRAHGVGVEIDAIPTIGIWNHWCASIGIDATDFYLNGELVDTRVMPSSLSSMEDVFGLGIHWWQGGVSTRLSADFDDFGIWNRALDSTEVMALYLGLPLVLGCTDTASCNYDPLANSDDSTCEYGCLYCGPGTHWDAILSACVADVPSAEAAENCTLMSLQELTEGYLNLLDIVAYQDSLLTAQQGGDQSDGDGTTTNWTCGDPLPYQGYDYATVLIGDQCWFAENLRTASYLNGDDIPEPSNQDEWATLLLGMSTVYGSDEHTCYSAWNFDACDDSLALGEYGRLYNWWAVDDSRGLCPLEWHVASNQEWFELEDHAAQNGFNGMEATALQSTSGWGVTGNGTDDFGFAAKPAGHCDFGGTFFYAGNRGKWWTSTYENGNGRYWYSTHMDPEIHSAVDTPKYGFSVRCIKD